MSRCRRRGWRKRRTVHPPAWARNRWREEREEGGNRLKIYKCRWAEEEKEEGDEGDRYPAVTTQRKVLARKRERERSGEREKEKERKRSWQKCQPGTFFIRSMKN